MDEAMRQALLLQKQQAPVEGAAPQGVTGPPGVADMSGGGGGNIGVGAAPVPGEAGFSAAPQQPAME